MRFWTRRGYALSYELSQPNHGISNPGIAAPRKPAHAPSDFEVMRQQRALERVEALKSAGLWNSTRRAA